MAVIYANADTGNDTTGNGSQALPYLTLNKCVDSASAGDTIELAIATAEYSYVDVNTFDNITVRGASTPNWAKQSWARIDMGGGELGGFNIKGVCTFNDLVFDNSVQSTRSLFRWQSTTGEGATWNRCIFNNITTYDSTGGRGGMVGCDTAALTFSGIYANFNDCLFNNVKATTDSTSGCIANCKAGFVNVAFTNCTFYWPSGATKLEGIVNENNVAATGSYPLKNCILVSDTAAPMPMAGLNVTSTEMTMTNCCYVNMTTTNVGITNSITSDPLFVDKTNGDFRLRPSSPAIDAGVLV